MLIIAVIFCSRLMIKIVGRGGVLVETMTIGLGVAL